MGLPYVLSSQMRQPANIQGVIRQRTAVAVNNLMLGGNREEFHRSFFD